MAFNQREQIVRYLKRHASIDPWTANIKLGISKLATRVSELRRQGVKIQKEWKAITTRNGKKTKVRAYRLA